MNDEVSPLFQMGVVMVLTSTLLSVSIVAYITVRPLFDNNLNKLQNSMVSSRHSELALIEANSVNTKYQGMTRENLVSAIAENIDEIHSICYVEAFRVTDGVKDSLYTRDNLDYTNNFKTYKYSTKQSIFYRNDNPIEHDEVLSKLMKAEVGSTRYSMHIQYDILDQLHIIVYPYAWNGLCEDVNTGEQYTVETSYTTQIFSPDEAPNTLRWIELYGISELIGG